MQDLDNCITEFDCDPFNLSNPTLRSLQSGMIVSDELVADFNTVHSDGESLVQSFFKERMFSNDSHLILQSTGIPHTTSANPQFKTDESAQKVTKNRHNGEQGYGRNNYCSSKVIRLPCSL